MTTTTIPPYGIAARAPRCATRRVATLHSDTVRSATVRSAASLLVRGGAGTMTTTHSHDGADRASRDTAGLGPTQPSTRPVHHTPAEVAAP